MRLRQTSLRVMSGEVPASTPSIYQMSGHLSQFTKNSLSHHKIICEPLVQERVRNVYPVPIPNVSHPFVPVLVVECKMQCTHCSFCVPTLSYFLRQVVHSFPVFFPP